MMYQELQKISLRICQCRPAAVQLMHRGLFGNAPKEPTLAVDLRFLDFVTRLFHRLAPNNTAICQTIEDFLGYQGYQLRGQVGTLVENLLRSTNIFHRIRSDDVFSSLYDGIMLCNNLQRAPSTRSYTPHESPSSTVPTTPSKWPLIGGPLHQTLPLHLPLRLVFRA
jgi:hypothetical protein